RSAGRLPVGDHGDRRWRRPSRHALRRRPGRPMSTTRPAQRTRAALAVIALLAALSPGRAHASATITIVNLDSAGGGLNDTTPLAPAGGNPGTTIGDQRFNAMQYAANLWGAVLNSTVEIRVGASFQPLTCNSSSAVLGQAGAASVHRDF